MRSILMVRCKQLLGFSFIARSNIEAMTTNGLDQCNFFADFWRQWLFEQLQHFVVYRGECLLSKVCLIFNVHISP